MAPTEVGVLLAEPSTDAREEIATLLAREPGLVVVGTASTGEEAIERAARLRPSVIVLGAGLGGPGVAATTRRIMTHDPRPIIVVTSGDAAELRHADRALEEGALSVQHVAVGTDDPGGRDPATRGANARFAVVVKALADVSLVRRRPRDGAPSRGAPAPRQLRMVAVAGSTGAPVALQQLLAGLPADLPVPVLAVQHLPPGYVETFVNWLDMATRLRVSVAADGHRPQAGEVLLAADGAHLRLDDHGRIERSDTAPVDGFRPSASVLFDSVARVHGPDVLALVLSGMGRDGVEGLRRVRATGGHVVAQDEESSVVFGMPGAAVAAGLADQVVPGDQLAALVAEAVRPRTEEQ